MEKSSLNKLSKEFYSLALASLFLMLAMWIINPILPLYITQKGATTLEMGMIISTLYFVTTFARLPLSILTDKIGKRYTIMISLVCLSIAFLLYSLAFNPVLFYPIRIFHGLPLAAFVPAALSLTHELALPKERGDAMGKFLTATGIGMMLGPFLSSLLIINKEYNYLFLTASIITLLGIVPFLCFGQTKSKFLPQKRDEIGLPKKLKAIILSRNMLILAYIRFSFAFVLALFTTLFALYAENSLLLTPSLIALIFGLKETINVVSRLPSGKFADRIDCKLLLYIGTVSMSISFLIIYQTTMMVFLVLAVILLGLAHGIRVVTEFTALGEFVSSEKRYLANAYITTIFGLGQALGALSAGALATSYSTPTIFMLASGIAIIEIPAITLIKTSSKII